MSDKSIENICLCVGVMVGLIICGWILNTLIKNYNK